MDLERIKRVAVAAAYKGADVLRRKLGKISGIDKKGASDLVTEADIGSEKIILSTIQTAFPDHAVLAEESGENNAVSDYQWLIDPLDGTTNFAHQLPIFCVSIAFAMQDDILVGVVLNPVNGELFSATRGQGARLNDQPVRVSGATAISESLLATGFPYNFHENFDPIITRYANCLRAARGIRRLGSAALDLCYVACGRFDGYWEQNLKPWDTAAGSLIASEAGAYVTDFSNRPFTVDANEILATNDGIHKEMLSLLQMSRCPGP
jgi:myo-inositol-1(or 4)-monophosphatase